MQLFISLSQRKPQTTIKEFVFMRLSRSFHIYPYHRIFILLFCSELLSACTTYPITATNDICGPWTFGIAQPSRQDKQFVSSVQHREETIHCLKTRYADGFALYESPPEKKVESSAKETTATPAMLPPISQPSNEQASLYLHPARLAAYNLDFLSETSWKSATSPSPMYHYFAKNIDKGAALFVSVFDANPFMIWSDVRDSVKGRLADEFDNPHISKIAEIQLNGKDAFQTELWGKSKEGAPLHFLATLIKYENGKERKLIYLATWCFESDYTKNQTDFKRIAETITLHPR